MMFLIPSLVLALASMVLAEETLETCSCWTEYRPQLMDNKPMCVGTKLNATKPCNIPEPSKCLCNPDFVTNITSDATGTRCAQYEMGVKIISWPCENAVVTLDTCSCWGHFRPQIQNNKTVCYPVAIRPMARRCNIPQPPKCVCDPAVGTSTTSDDTDGPRCSRSEKGVEIKSWPCENAVQWEAFEKIMKINKNKYPPM